MVYIEFIKYRVSILDILISTGLERTETYLTLLKEAVKTTTSYISPIFCKNWSTPGRLIT
jgi:hypothetical protein